MHVLGATPRNGEIFVSRRAGTEACPYTEPHRMRGQGVGWPTVVAV